MAHQPGHFPKQCAVGDLSLIERALEKQEVPKLYALVKAAGWPFTSEDIQCIFDQSPGQMFGLFDDSGRLVSSCTGILLSDDEAFIPLFVTLGEYRGRGLGSTIFKLTMQSLGDRNVTLFADEGTPPMYQKLGLVVTGDAFLVECDGHLKRQPSGNLPDAVAPVVKIEKVNEDTVTSVSDYERCVSNLNRPVMFSEKMSIPGNYCFRAVSKDGARVVGYILAQTREKALIISGLHADDIHTARALWTAVVNAVPNTCETVALFGFGGTYEEFASVLQQNTDGELRVIHKVYHLATKSVPPIDWQRVFAFNVLSWSATQ